MLSQRAACRVSARKACKFNTCPGSVTGPLAGIPEEFVLSKPGDRDPSKAVWLIAWLVWEFTMPAEWARFEPPSPIAPLLGKGLLLTGSPVAKVPTIELLAASVIPEGGTKGAALGDWPEEGAIDKFVDVGTAPVTGAALPATPFTDAGFAAKAAEDRFARCTIESELMAALRLLPIRFVFPALAVPATGLLPPALTGCSVVLAKVDCTNPSTLAAQGAEMGALPVEK